MENNLYFKRRLNLKKIKIENLLNMDVYSSLECDINDSPYEDATIFLHGSCDIFAYALNLNFGYDICYAFDKYCNKNVHYYCEINYCEKKYYVDIRGIYKTEDALLYEFCGKEWIIKKVKYSQNLSDEFIDIGFLFAVAILNKYRRYYILH